MAHPPRNLLNVASSDWSSTRNVGFHTTSLLPAGPPILARRGTEGQEEEEEMEEEEEQAKEGWGM